MLINFSGVHSIERISVCSEFIYNGFHYKSLSVVLTGKFRVDNLVVLYLNRGDFYSFYVEVFRNGDS